MNERKVMEQALEALEGLIKKTSGQSVYSFMETERRIAMSACVGIKEVLAQQSNEQVEPVAWRDHVEQRLMTWRQSFVNRSGDSLALDDFMDKQSLDDLLDYVLSEFAYPPVPTAQQEQEPAPVAKVVSTSEHQAIIQWLDKPMPSDSRLFTHQQNLSCKSTQARLAASWGYVKAEPLSDEQIHRASTQAGMQEHYMGFHSGFIRFAKEIEKAHGIGCKTTLVNEKNV